MSKTVSLFVMGIVAAVLGSLLTASASAALVQVDMQQTGATTQSGWQAWDSSADASSSVSSSFSYADTTGGTLGVTFTANVPNIYPRNYGLDSVTDPGNLTYPNVWADQIFSNGFTDGWVELQLDNLKAGQYSFSSYHFADGFITAQRGVADVFVNNTDTGVDQVFLCATNYTANEMETDGIFTSNFTVANDDDPVTIKYAYNSSGGNSFGLNGFEVTLIPEPASLALLGLGGLLIAGRRRRRRQ